jgi:hypothetical protein
MQHFDEQAPLQPYDQSHGLPSAPDLPTHRASNSQRQSALNHSILSYSADALDEEPNAQRQGPEITEGGHDPHRDLPPLTRKGDTRWEKWVRAGRLLVAVRKSHCP